MNKPLTEEQLVPQRPTGGTPLTPEQVSWNMRVFSHLGWQSKTVAQTTMREKMQDGIGRLDRSVLQPGQGPNCTARLKQEKLKPGKEFKTFQSWLERFEQAEPGARAQLVDDLQAAAQGYLDHWAKHSDREKRDEATKRKKEVCEQTLRDLRKVNYANELKALGDPPWNSLDAMTAASLKATIDLETLDDPKVEVLGGNHAFPAYWVSGAPGQDQMESPKSFLFKPMGGENNLKIPPGGEVTREAMTGRVADLIDGMTGLKLGVPETHVVSLTADRLPGGQEGDAPLTGSLQEYAETQGGMRDKSRKVLAKVTPESCQKIMLLDMITLNMDRHADNALLQGEDTETPQLVPIDHGLTFPPPEALTLLAQKMGVPMNALLCLPGAQAPFTEEMQAAIGKLDPDSMAAALRRERNLLERAHPSTKGTLSNEAVDISRRAMMFLKQAVATYPTLSPAVVQAGLAAYGGELLDPTLSDDAFTEQAEAAIKQIAESQGALTEFFRLTPVEQTRVMVRLEENGWSNAFTTFAGVVRNAQLVMNLYKTDTKQPALLRELTDDLGQQIMERELSKGATLKQILNRRGALLQELPKRDTPTTTGEEQEEASEQDRADAQSFKQSFPGNFVGVSVSAVLSAAKNWREFQELGGEASLNETYKALRMVPLRGNAANWTSVKKLMIEAAALAQAGQDMSEQNIDAGAVRAGQRILATLQADLPDDSGLRTTVENVLSEEPTGAEQQLTRVRQLISDTTEEIRTAFTRQLQALKPRVSKDDATRLDNKLLEFSSGQMAGIKSFTKDLERKYPT